MLFLHLGEAFINPEGGLYYKASQNHRNRDNHNGFRKCSRLFHALPSYQIGGLDVIALLGDVWLTA